MSQLSATVLKSARQPHTSLRDDTAPAIRKSRPRGKTQLYDMHAVQPRAVAAQQGVATSQHITPSLQSVPSLPGAQARTMDGTYSVLLAFPLRVSTIGALATHVISLRCYCGRFGKRAVRRIIEVSLARAAIPRVRPASIFPIHLSFFMRNARARARAWAFSPRKAIPTLFACTICPVNDAKGVTDAETCRPYQDCRFDAVGIEIVLPTLSTSN
jgi:hypothetical protein